MDREQFSYKFPKRATMYPKKRGRSECKLMVVHRKTGKFEHYPFSFITKILEDEVLYANNAVYANHNPVTGMDQPVYANRSRTWFCPSAGVPFTEEMVKELNFKFITLTTDKDMDFDPVKIFEREKTPTEVWFSPDPPLEPVIAIGTTVVKTLESQARTGGVEGTSELFISPGFIFKKTKGLLTNFHFPREPLLALTCAFGGKDLILKAYEEAMSKKYLISNRGDRMLILD